MEAEKQKKQTIWRHLLKGSFLFSEGVFLCLLYYLVWRKGYSPSLFPPFYYKGKYVLVGVYALLLSFFFHNFEGFSPDLRRGVDLALRRGIALFLLNFITYFQLSLIANRPISPLPLLVLYGLQMFLSLFLVALYKKICRTVFEPEHLLLIYGSRPALELKGKVDSRKDRYQIKKTVSQNLGAENLTREILLFDGVILNDLDAPLRNDLLKFSYARGKRVYAVPKISDILMGGGKTLTLFDTPIIAVSDGKIPFPQSFFKRCFDLFFTACVLLFLSPLLLICALAIKMEDGGDVFYRQKRLTLGEKEFEIIKFRSMIPGAEAKSGATLSSGENDPRVTKVGRILRKYRLDELPQLWNVLKGDMSLVGPRPERKVFAEEFCKTMPEFAFRTKVKGGLTGFAQIYGKYNTDPYDKLRLDLMYLEKASLALDLKLIFLTLKVMFTKESTEGTEAKEKEKRRWNKEGEK